MGLRNELHPQSDDFNAGVMAALRWAHGSIESHREAFIERYGAGSEAVKAAEMDAFCIFRCLRQFHQATAAAEPAA